MIPRKKKLETIINTCVSLIKEHWKKMAEIPQKRNFLPWSIQNFVTVRKYCTSWLIDLANKLYDIEKFIDFMLCHVLLKIVLFY